MSALAPLFEMERTFVSQAESAAFDPSWRGPDRNPAAQRAADV